MDGPTRDDAWGLVCEWIASDSLRKHVLGVEAAMRAYARRDGEDEELWGITGLVHSAEGSSAVVNAVYLPMAIIAGTFFTPKEYPSFLKTIAEVLPLTHYTQLTRDVMLRHQHFWHDGGAIAVVAVWGAIGLVAAIRTFRWQPREA